MSAPPLPPPGPAADELLAAVLAVSLTPLALLRPVRGAGEAVVDFAVEHLNPAAERQLGLPTQPTQTLLALFPGEPFAGGLAFLAAALALGSGEQEFAVRPGSERRVRVAARRSGERLVVSFSASPGPGDVAQVMHERETRESPAAEARRQRAQLYQVLRQAPAAICVLEGPALTYQYLNPTCQRVFPGRALLGRPLLAALPELRGTAILDQLAVVYATGRPYHAHELRVPLCRAGGEPLEDTYWTLIWLARRNALGEIDGVLCFGYEVSEQVRARQAVEASQHRSQALTDELSQANTQLRRTNADLDNFIYVASHDLRAPISNLEGLLHALRQELAAAPASIAQLLHLMDDSVLRFQRTITYLTDISRLQKATDEPATPVALAGLIEAVRLDLAPQQAALGGELTVDVAACPTVAFSEKNLRSIFYNLISNGFKYRAAGRRPRVAVRSYAQAGCAVLEVQDNGLGLTPTQQQRLFGMFQRLHDHVDGSGIGLYMVKKIVENAEGRVEVESAAGVGSVFRVFLPAAGTGGG